VVEVGTVEVLVDTETLAIGLLLDMIEVEEVEMMAPDTPGAGAQTILLK
jgi:hypothetical protein